MRRTARCAVALTAIIGAAALAGCSSTSDPSGYYHRSGRTVHSDTFPDYNRGGHGPIDRYPVGIPRGRF